MNDAVIYGNPISTYIATLSNNSAEPDTNSGSGGAWSLLAAAGGVGPAGPTGAAATVSVGTIATGAAGSSASVTNIGTGTAAILNFTIPQGATGPAGSGGGGGGISGFSGAAVYHSVYGGSPLYLAYYSVSNSTATSSESASPQMPFTPYTSLSEPNAVLTWVPAGCTATALNVFSEQGGTITVTLRIGTPGNMASSTDLTCTATTGNSCSATGSDTVSAGSFVDLSISGANSSAAGVWTALTCN